VSVLRKAQGRVGLIPCRQLPHLCAALAPWEGHDIQKALSSMGKARAWSRDYVTLLKPWYIQTAEQSDILQELRHPLFNPAAVHA